jgi:hypothetical protein
MLVKARPRPANRFEATLVAFSGGRDVRIAMRYRGASARGKYVVAQRGEEIVIAFDERAEFHLDLVEDLGAVEPLGGGWLEIDGARRTLQLGGKSEMYDREPDRALTLRALSRVYPAYACSIAD